jgi:hypothetical protein
VVLLKKSVVFTACILYVVMSALLVGLVHAIFVWDDCWAEGATTWAYAYVSGNFYGGLIHYPYYVSEALEKGPHALPLVMKYEFKIYSNGQWTLLDQNTLTDWDRTGKLNYSRSFPSETGNVALCNTWSTRNGNP